ncbi:MAG: tripartite tricarboxylate transporter family receptor, partial [Rhodospirillales bacterium]|nr:tripartite tricarboxylate transporter family receptor [Rhodospirillales bacterium]
MLRLAHFVLFTICVAFGAAPASAQSPSTSVGDFYKDKNLEIVVGYTPGGGYDLAARVLSRHIGKYIPGEPKIIIRNMPGAGTVLAANHVNNVAPKDGTVMGIYADLMPVAKLLGVPGVQFDPAKFGWIGSITSRGTPMLI